MPASIGVNLRVTGHCSQGGRKYMEDLFSVAYQQTEDERDLEYAFFGIYDGHGGSEAAAFAKEHLMDSIVKQRQFWSDNDEDVLKAIRNGYMLTHLNMWKELEKWPKTVTGLPSTAGTTASVAFIRRGKIYIGHVGDSAIVLGYQKEGSEEWAAKPLTSDHKPESTAEIERIQRCGGKVVSKAGVPRVVWNRPRLGHKGPIKKNTLMDEIPFLAVARSLGDLWSYNPQNDEFIVSPDPDVGVLTIDPTKFRCLIFGTDGLWNMISPEGAVSLVQATERHNEAALVGGGSTQPRDWLNPSKSLVDHALERWSNTRMRADNTSVVTLMLDPPGPPRATVLRSRTTQRPQQPAGAAAPAAPGGAAPAGADHKPNPPADAEHRPVPQNGLTIMTRYSDVDKPAASADVPDKTPLPPCDTINGRFSVAPQEKKEHENEDNETMTNYGNPAESYFMARLLNRSRVVNTLSEVYDEIVNGKTSRTETEARETSPLATAVPEAGDAEPHAAPDKETAVEAAGRTVADADHPDRDDGGIQINEVSSSSPTEGPPRPRGRRPKAESKREVPAPHDRVLRSHQDAEPPPPPRPHTRQTAGRGRAAPPPPAAALERVVILSRRAAAAPAEPLVRVERPTVRRAAPPPPAEPALAPASPERARATRSSAAAPAPAAGRAAPSARAGNCARAPGAARRPAPAARREPGSRGSKENLGAARRRARARAAPGAGPRPRRAGSEPEVHSTTLDAPACRVAPPPPPPPERPRALRSRNDAEAPPLAGGKRGREDAAPAPTAKAPKLAAERCARALGKRASGPWAPALALRNRLRKRLAK
ncbi:protein phosphatase 1B [Pectinophora gossypiella]|uniref:protein phosphatase 1B n=1 Tax=Pectinophora gossypiella TaxID=13191 RepID=UPI00214E1E00|nr:protein phosphatase 1B [Pectinophora gossypiella]